MTVRDLLSHLGAPYLGGNPDARVTQITMDSRRVAPGALFVCTPGMTNDSHQFLADAQHRGAVAAVTHNREGEELAESLGLVVCPLADSRPHFNWSILRLCSAFYESPTAKMCTFGITGTNGKTTTAWLIREILERLGEPTAYLGTLGYLRTDRGIPLNNTTPFPTELFELISEARDAGVRALAMEVSSHALDERRVISTMFDVGVFTNLTQDHLDHHVTMAAYEAAKFRIFEEASWRQEAIRAVINVDDPTGRRWAKSARFIPWSEDHWRSPRLLRFGKGGDFEATELDIRVDSIAFQLRTPVGTFPVAAPLGGDFNVENLVGAITAVYAADHPIEAIIEAAHGVRPVPGRFEPVPNDKGIGVIVDYAHTPDALIKLLTAARRSTNGRLITVFGCGGDRDRTKRPLMAAAASLMSDLTVVTSDNPRTEDPESIIREVLVGIQAGAEALTAVDRWDAVRIAISSAQPGDTVVLAGKGHEEYQIIGREKVPMSDREMAREALG